MLQAKIGDNIALETYELNPEYRYQTFKVVDIFRGKITVRPYHSYRRIIVEDEQRLKLISKEEFKTLTT